MAASLLQHVTTVHAGVTHVRIEGDRVAAVGADLHPEAGDHVVDLTGHLLVPAAVEPHAHLDKAYLAERIENPTGDLMGAIEAMATNWPGTDPGDIVERAERAARRMAANGYVAVRTHADVVQVHGLHSVEALVEVRRRVAPLIDVEIVALTGSPVCGAAGADHRALLQDALAAGADLVGGCPHLEDGGDLDGATDVLLAIAAEHGVGVDLHTDETLDPAARGLAALARRVVADGFEHRVTASHCVSLGQQPLDEQRRTAELVAEAGIGVVTLPQTNLFLQGRGRVPMPRGLTAVDVLRSAGVVVAAGADNLQDPFNPVGRACPFEIAALMVVAAHDLPEAAWRSVSTDAATVIGRAAVDVVPGSPADLLAVPARSLRAAIAEGPDGRRIWRNGVEIVPS